MNNQTLKGTVHVVVCSLLIAICYLMLLNTLKITERSTTFGINMKSVPPKLYNNRSRLWKVVKPDKKRCVVDCVNGEPINCYDADLSFKTFEIKQTSMMNESTNERHKSFTEIFQKRIWTGMSNNEHSDHIWASGGGSLLRSTRLIHKILHTVIDEIKLIKGLHRVKMLDIPCGDMTWMPYFLAERNDVDYYGMDIVPDLINHNKNLYKDKLNWTFIQGDIVQGLVLNTTFDLIFTRQMTQHLTNQETLQMLKTVSESTASFLLASTYRNVQINRELDLELVGRCRPQNLELPPYQLVPPICLGRDLGNCSVALWELPLRQVGHDLEGLFDLGGIPKPIQKCT